MHLEKDDIRHTRRIMETYNNKSINTAATKFALTCKKDAITRLKKYVHKTSLFEDSPEGMAEQFEWTPCRFNTLGWKYQKQGTFQSFLNHSNKVNAVGGVGP